MCKVWRVGVRRLEVAQRTASTLESEVAELRQQLASAESAASASEAAASERYSALINERRETDALSVGSTTMFGELQRTEAALEAEEPLEVGKFPSSN